MLAPRGSQQNEGPSGTVLALKLICQLFFTSRAVVAMALIHASHLAVTGSKLLDRYTTGVSQGSRVRVQVE